MSLSDKSLTLRGSNADIACTTTREPETIIQSASTTVMIAANEVTLDGFQIIGNTGISTNGYTDITIQNNLVEANEIGIVNQNIQSPYTIQNNCISLNMQTYSVQGFDTEITLSDTQQAGAWYVDRYAPAEFVREVFDGNQRLKHSLSVDDGANNRPGGFQGVFYNTQGRKYDTNDITSFAIDLYIPSDWQTTDRRMAGLWGTAFNITDAISFYPIIEFTSTESTPRFRAWTGSGWMDLGLPAGFAYDSWYTLNISLIDNMLVYSVEDLSLAFPHNDSVRIGNVILQGYNTDTGVAYDIYWDNLTLFDVPAENGNNPTTGVAIIGAIGSDMSINNNNISGAFYGYLLHAVNTTPATTINGGDITGVMQGVAVVNTLDNTNFFPSTFAVDGVTMSGFVGDYVAIPSANFHSGVYVFTGGGTTGASTITGALTNVDVDGTQKPQQNSAALHFADFGAQANAQTITVNGGNLTNNVNRGIYARANAVVTVDGATLTNNGADPFGASGNDGYSVIAREGASISIENSTITNPAAQITGVSYAFHASAGTNNLLVRGNQISNGNVFQIG
jgi:hypothetical protein